MRAFAPRILHSGVHSVKTITRESSPAVAGRRISFYSVPKEKNNIHTVTGVTANPNGLTRGACGAVRPALIIDGSVQTWLLVCVRLGDKVACMGGVWSSVRNHLHVFPSPAPRGARVPVEGGSLGPVVG